MIGDPPFAARGGENVAPDRQGSRCHNPRKSRKALCVIDAPAFQHRARIVDDGGGAARNQLDRGLQCVAAEIGIPYRIEDELVRR